MNNKPLMIAISVGFVLLTAYLFRMSADKGADQYSSIEQAVRAIDQRNADLDSAVLSLRLGLTSNYDELAGCERDLERTTYSAEALLAETVWSERLRKHLRPLLDEKGLLTTDFKANHAVVRNSVAGFRRKIGQMRVNSGGHSATHQSGLTNLEMLGARFTITGDINDKKQFEFAINNIESSLQEKKRSSHDSTALSFAIRHARNLIDRRIELDDTITRLVTVPVKTATKQILDQATEEYQVNSEVAGRFRLGLMGTIALVIMFCFFQYYSLLKHKKIIHRSNVMLEQRVKERTADLADVNKDLEHAIAEAQKLALVARYTDNAVVITDSQARIEWVNDGFQRITGYEPEEVVGRMRQEILHGPETDAAQLEHMRSSFNENTGFDIETINYRKDGSPFWVAIEARPIQNDKGEVDRFIAIESDVTNRVNAEMERQKLNERLVDASRHAGMAEVATGVLHNVGNILNSVNVSASIIQAQFQKSAIDNLERMSGLISEHENNFADFVKNDQRGRKIPAYINKVTKALKSEHQHIDNEFRDLLNNVGHIKEIVAVQQSMATSSGLNRTLSVADLVSDALTANKGSLANHNVNVSTKIEGDLPPLVSDKHKILQILVNLIKNAKDAMVEHNVAEPKIRVCVTSCGENVSFKVIDNGIGIPEDKIETIFQHGFTTKKTGHGFGLHSSANAATELGGTLTASSSGAGRGATFDLRLPHDPAAYCKTKAEFVTA